MFALMVRYYDGVTREQFEADLDGKQHLIRMFDADGGLCGFSTIQLIPFDYEGRPTLTVFSGDTVIDRACWGQKALQKAFGQFLLRLLITRRERLYWFLISKGFKTYLYMRHNLTSYPNHAQPTPPEFQALLDHMAGLKYPEHYDPQRGVIEFPGETCVVKDAHDCLVATDLEDPDIRFFVERNPGYVRGDELCCLARVTVREVVWSALRYGVGAPLKRLFKPRPRPKASAPVPAQSR